MMTKGRHKETEVRDYQDSCIRSVRARFGKGAQSVLLVSPTGSGKTFLGVQLVSSHKTLWVAHTRELVEQAAINLQEAVGTENVGIIMPGYEENPGARIQVGTVQTLIARGSPDVSMVVLDEAHHYVAEHWRSIVHRYKGVRTLGLTATPEREQGDPLGDIFEELVVAARYPDLVEQGYLTPWDVYQPTQHLGRHLAEDPLSAWEKLADDTRTIAFFPQVKLARQFAIRASRAGIPAESVDCYMGESSRREVISRFRMGKTKMLVNVDVLTEGFDVPEAETIILARPMRSQTAYLQACGRASRASPGKANALLIDLCGGSLIHGSPVSDRIYSLEGKGIALREDEVEEDDEKRVARNESVDPQVYDQDVLGGVQMRMYSHDGRNMVFKAVPKQIASEDEVVGLRRKRRKQQPTKQRKTNRKLENVVKGWPL